MECKYGVTDNSYVDSMKVSHVPNICCMMIIGLKSKSILHVFF